MKKMKFLKISILSILMLLILSGCSDKQEENVTLEIWHYYNGTQKIAFDQLILDFNETLGLEKGIIVEAFSQGNINQLEENIIESIEEKVGSSDIPNMLTTYPEIAYMLDQQEILANLEDYITDKEINQYLESYIEEGRLGEDNQFKIFPTAKATEVMMLNKTDWDKFEAATGVRTSELETWEGLRRTGELYYKWTDSLTEEENDGKSFFGRDALANYILVGSKQLGKEIFKVSNGQITLDLDPDIMRKLWDNYYIPYVSGYYKSYGRFSTDDAKTGEIIALVGSTTGATYFPDNVTIGENDSYDIDLMVLPLPNFEGRGYDAVQQGAGISVLQSDKFQEEASVEFLKWFTDESRNLDFSIKTGYLPVKKESYDISKVENKFEQDSREDLSPQLKATISLAMNQIEKYDLHITKAFNNGNKAREILETSLEDRAKTDRKKFIDFINRGIGHEEVVERFSSDENFKEWLLDFEDSLNGAIVNEG